MIREGVEDFFQVFIYVHLREKSFTIIPAIFQQKRTHKHLLVLIQI